jgi:heptosyltransferase-3
MRILVLRGGALGDFLVTLPALALLRDRWPDARIELVGNLSAAALGLSARVLNAVHSQHEARWGALYDSAPLPPAFTTVLAAFDLVVNYWPDPDGELRGKFPARPGQIFLSAPAVPTLGPAAVHYCEPLRQLGLAPDSLLFPLRVPAPEPRLVAIHPGSGSPQKNWPSDRWLALAHWLERELRADVRVILGEAEPDDLLAGVGRHIRNRPLGDLADQLARCRLFLGHDSGVSHLAASAGAPGIILFGPTDSAIWAPPSPNVRVLKSGSAVSAISLADVQHAVRLALPDLS